MFIKNYFSGILKPLILINLFLFFYLFNFAQGIKKESLIIDTDAAPDDLRAICMFLSVPEINVLAITTSDGSLSPEEGFYKVNTLLKSLNIYNISTGSGREMNSLSPGWKIFCKSIDWNYNNVDTTGISNMYKNNSAKDVIINKLLNSNDPVTLICLGSLTNLNDAINKSPGIKSKIKKIIWYNDYLNQKSSSNYNFDKVSADIIIKSDLLIDNISDLNNKSIIFDTTFLKSIDKIQTKYAKAISFSHHKTNIYNKIIEQHLKIWDDLIPVYILFPDLFDMEEDKKNPNHKYCTNYFFNPVREKIYEILSQIYDLSKNVSFEIFPVDSNQYKYDIKPYINNIINKYGKEEWKACVLTNEIHGHLGVYSIIGAKMGIKAREILNAPIDRITVVSYALSEPPLGCINDGLQVSTGATLGLGMITIVKDSIPLPEAIFEYKNRKVKIRLKEKYQQQIDYDLNQSILQYGNLTDGYWKLVRKLAIIYWEQWDRNEIFEIRELNN